MKIRKSPLGLMLNCLPLLIFVINCSNYDPQDIVIALRPLEHVTATLEQYLNNLPSQEEQRLLRAFIIRNRIESTFLAPQDLIVGKRLGSLLELQREWEKKANNRKPDQKELSNKITFSISELDRAYYISADLWPDWQVIRYQIEANLQNTDPQAFTSVTGTLFVSTLNGSPLAQIPLTLKRPNEVNKWSWLLSLDYFFPREKTNQSKKYQEVFPFLENYVNATKNYTDLKMAIVEKLESGGTINPLKEQKELAEANIAMIEAESNLLRQGGKGSVINDSSGPVSFVPSLPITYSPERKIFQLIPLDFMKSLDFHFKID